MSSNLLLAFGLSLFAHPLGDSARLQTSLQMAEAAQVGRSTSQTFVELYILDAGVPVPGVDAKVDGKVVATTDAYGAIYVKIPSGRVDFELVRDGEIIYQVDLLTDEGEIVLFNLLIPSDGGEPKVLIENSGRSSILAGEQSEEERPQEKKQEDAPPGALVGQITSIEGGAPVTGARVFFTGTRQEAETDQDGRYAVELSAGTYSVSVIRPGFATQTIDDVRVIPGKEVTANIELSPAGVRLKDYIVTAPYIEGSIASSLDQQREASGVSDVLGAAQISATGDSNAAEALSRVTGLTIEEGRFVLVRGQPYRFTLALFNDSPLPSPEPLLRVVPLDLFPSGVLKDIEVQKAFTPDVPASFGAGLVRINTRGVPDEAFARVSVSTGYNSESTFLQGATYDGGGLDVFGFDDGTRALPDPFLEATDDQRIPIGEVDNQAEVGQSFSNNLERRNLTLPPDFGLSLSAGKSWDIFDDGEFGATGTYQWSNQWRRQRRIQRTFNFQQSTQELSFRDDTQEFRTDREAEMSGLVTLALNWENHEFASNTFLVNQARDRTQLTTGRERGSDELLVRRTLLNWIERSLIAQQLSAHNDFGPVVLDYRGLIARAARDAPDRREYDFVQVESLPDFGFRVRDPLGLDREYSNVSDVEYALGFDISIPAFAPEDSFLRVTPKLGVYGDFTERQAAQQRLRFRPTQAGDSQRLITDPSVVFDPQRVGSLLEIQDLAFNTGDDYSGTQDIWAVYGMADIFLGDILRIVGGLRYEEARVTVETFTEGPEGTEGNDTGGFDQTGEESLFPAASLTWFIREELQARLAYGRSTSRPTLNELSRSFFFDPDSGQQFLGDPELRPTLIDGYDARLEWYPSPTESLNGGVFLKNYTDPLERTFTASGGDNSIATFQNASSAVVWGIELGGRFEFSRLVDWVGAPRIFDKIYTMANASILFSTVTLVDQGVATDSTRNLDGQADFVFNLQLGYDGDVHDVTIAFNQIGSRLRRVGIRGRPNIIQDPIPTLDVNWTWQLTDNLKFRLSGGNLLNPEVRFTQQAGDQEAQVFRSFRRGLDISTSLAWTFL